MSLSVLIAAVVGVVMFPFIGAAGQRHGRRQVFVALGALNTVAAPVFLWLAIAGPRSRFLSSCSERCP
ncbi:MAG: transporter [Blastococcus sp.]|nr:transporter [Blastococcus sp.]